MTTLADFGWNDAFTAAYTELGAHGTLPGRIVADFGTSLKVATPKIITAELSGKLAHYSNRDDAPKVGDWVALRPSMSGNAVIEARVPRASEVARKVTGRRTAKQTLAANVDVAFVLLALDGDFSVDRVRRFLYQLSINSIEPVIVLNKADKTNDLNSFMQQLDSLDVPVITTVAVEGKGIDEILAYITPGRTAILLGSSGVGKSTITNQLLGREVQATQAVRERDDTGKHTTVHRELFVLANGGLLIDTPGIRELQLWGTEDDLKDNFDDVTTLAAQCKYNSCKHRADDGCAVQQALQTGALSADRYAAYQTMQAELATLKTRSTAHLKKSSSKAKRKSRERSIARDNYRL